MRRAILGLASVLVLVPLSLTGCAEGGYDAACDDPTSPTLCSGGGNPALVSDGGLGRSAGDGAALTAATGAATGNVAIAPGAVASTGAGAGAGAAGTNASTASTPGSGGTTSSTTSAAGASASTGGSVSGTDAGQQSDAGGGSAETGGGVTGATGDIVPILPEIVGDCPTFKAGTSTVTVQGIQGTVIAGAKKEGTGSLLIYFYGTFKAGDVNFLPAAVKSDITAQGGMIFAPNEAKNTGGDCSGTGTFGIDDFKVVDQVVACAVKNYGINPKRIYATGCSAGGLTTGCIAIRRSNYIAAVAPNSGGVTIGYGKLQNPKHMPDAITMNGGSGDNVIVNFGETSEGFDNYVLKYGGFAVNCIHSSGHCGAPAALYSSAWQFLKDHPFGTKPSPYANALPSGFNSTCKIFQMTSRAPLGGF